MLLVAFFFLHIMSCLWWALSDTYNEGSSNPRNWFYRLNEVNLNLPYHSIHASEGHSHRYFFEFYMQSFYYTTLMFVGDGVEPITPGQHVFATMCLVIGVVLVAVLIGDISLIMAKVRAAQTEYDLKMERVNRSMSQLHLPRGLQDRVRNFYGMLWRNHHITDGEPAPFLHELSPSALRV